MNGVYCCYMYQVSE